MRVVVKKDFSDKFSKKLFLIILSVISHDHYNSKYFFQNFTMGMGRSKASLDMSTQLLCQGKDLSETVLKLFTKYQQKIFQISFQR